MQHQHPTDDERAQARIGLAYGIAAYSWWGLVAIYFKAVAHVPATEVLAHRIIWAAPMLAILTRMRGRWSVAVTALKDRHVILMLIGSTVLIAANWFTFIWAVANNHVAEASLGYFINPLVNILLGFLFLGERLRRIQWACVALAAAGVSYQTYAAGSLPIVALILAMTFGLYGLMRKIARVDALVGLTLECVLLFPLALTYGVYMVLGGTGEFLKGSISTNILLALGGVITAVPLLWFSNAVRRLRLATIGFLQYIAPTGQFLLAVFLYHEPFTRSKRIAFTAIWIALAIYTADSWRASKKNQKKSAGPNNEPGA
jgi:chloramphenicol-sensitive protein RarD